MADLAGSGEVLLTDATRQALGAALAVRELGPRRFKNVAEPLRVYSLALEEDRARLPVDPVCHMAVEPQRAAARQTVSDVEYFLCSPECARAFAADPHRYISPA